MRIGGMVLGIGIAVVIVAAWGIVGSGQTHRIPGLRPAVEQAAGPGDVVVYKSPTCGCCDGWIDHMRAAGYRVIARDTSDVGAVKRRLGVLPTLGSCHTAVLAGYVIEGHVPADAVGKLLEERPAIVGIAVPGMPAGSPGMEDAKPHVSYDVVAFDSTGRTWAFARY